MIKRLLIAALLTTALYADVCQDANRGAIWCPSGWQFNTIYCTGPCGYPWKGNAEYAYYYCPGNPAGEQVCNHWMNCSCSGPASFTEPFKSMVKKWFRDNLRLTLWEDPPTATTKAGCPVKAIL